jgi:hypothetical protein
VSRRSFHYFNHVTDFQIEFARSEIGKKDNHENNFKPFHRRDAEAQRIKLATAFSLSPVRRQGFGRESGEMGEHCLSAKRELRSRPLGRAAQGTQQGQRTGVAFFLVTFSWRHKKK